MYEIEITAEGLRHLNRPPEKVRHAALTSIFGPIAENPNRLGKPLVGELEGLWSARCGGYRLIYELFEDDWVVLIHRVQRRRDAYRPRSTARLCALGVSDQQVRDGARRAVRRELERRGDLSRFSGVVA